MYSATVGMRPSLEHATPPPALVRYACSTHRRSVTQSPWNDIIGNIMIRVLLDTNVLVAGLSSSMGASHAVLQTVAASKIEVAASTALWLEYESVLKRDEIRALHGFSATEIDTVLSALAVWVRPVMLHYLWRPQLRDPSDEMVLEAAVNGHVQAIVTHNTKDFVRIAPDFGVRVLTPAQLLLMMEKKP
jgi:putative PIN family toxin of toxin-antitoxin system